MTFYTTIASSMGILISISIALITYLLQQRSQGREKIELELKKLNILISNICETAETADEPRIRDQNRDLSAHLNKVIENYNQWRHIDFEKNEYIYEDEKYRPFIKSLNSLQDKIYRILIHKLHKTIRLDKHGKNYKYIVSLDDYEWYMKTVYPYLNKIEGIYTALGGGSILNDNLNYRSIQLGKENEKYYAEFWDMLLDMRTKSINIDNLVDEYYRGNLLTYDRAGIFEKLI